MIRHSYTKWVLVVIGICLISCGNRNYQLIEREDGTIIRLNKETGEIVVVDGDSIKEVVVDTVRDTVTQKIGDEAPRKKPLIRSKYDKLFAAHRSQVYEWETLKFTDQAGKTINAKAYLKSRISEGTVQYIFRMHIVSKACYKKDSHDLRVMFFNQAGAELLAFDIHAGKKNIVWQPDGKTIDICVAQAVSCTEETAKQFAWWRLQWTWFEQIIKK